MKKITKELRYKKMEDKNMNRTGKIGEMVEINSDVKFTIEIIEILEKIHLSIPLSIRKIYYPIFKSDKYYNIFVFKEYTGCHPFVISEYDEKILLKKIEKFLNKKLNKGNGRWNIN
jgi:hypothetical protein